MISRSSSVLFVTALALAACEPAAEEAPVTEEAPLAEEAPITDEELPAAGEMAETPTAGATVTEQVTVSNSMPHPMIVFVEENGQARDLGTVAPNGTSTFSVDAAEGATVTLQARDSADTHTVQTTVTAGGTAESWTIGG